MIYFYITIFLGFTALAYMRYEVTRLTIDRVYITKSKNNLKVIHISDIHIKFIKVDFQKVRDIISKENPDLIILSGDYIDNPRHIPKFYEFLSFIEGNNNIYLCFGNHDYKAFRHDPKKISEFIEELGSKGVTVLHNQCHHFLKNSHKYNIVGIEDFKSQRYDINKALSKCAKDAKATIAFSHNPDIIYELKNQRVDFLLCGHFHGGQIWMPFNLEFKLLRRERLCKKGIYKGLHNINNILLYINSGIGNVMFPLRFLSPPSISIIYFP